MVLKAVLVLRSWSSLFTHPFQAKPCRCSREVVSIIERIDFDCPINLMLAIISLTAPFTVLAETGSHLSDITIGNGFIRLGYVSKV